MALGTLFRRRTASPVAEQVDLVEMVLSSLSTGLVLNEEAGYIDNAIFLGRESKNGYEYTDQALQDSARLCEGVEININHPDGPTSRQRTLIEGWGVGRNVTTADGVNRGRIDYLKTHPDTPLILERIKRGFPIGLSPNQIGKPVRSANGKALIEYVSRVRSVDLVRNPATSKNLSESVQPTMKKTIASIVAEHKATAPEFVGLLESADQKLEIELAESATPAEQLLEAVGAATLTLLESSNNDFAKAQASVAKAFGLTVVAKGGGKDAPPAGDPPKGDKSLLESIVEPLKAELAAMKKDATIARVLDSHNLTRAGIGAERVKLLESQADEAAMSKIIADWPPAARGERGSFGGAVNLKEQAGSVPTTFEGVRSLIRGR